MSRVFRILDHSRLRKNFLSGLISAALVVVVALPSATADSQNDPKRVASDAVDRNAEQIATVGDVIYYYAEPYRARRCVNFI